MLHGHQCSRPKVLLDRPRMLERAMRHWRPVLCRKKARNFIGERNGMSDILDNMANKSAPIGFTRCDNCQGEYRDGTTHKCPFPDEHNGHDVSVAVVTPDPEHMAYECGTCQCQAWMLFEDGLIKCGSCQVVSQMMWREGRSSTSRPPKLRFSRLLNQESFACPRCSYNGFHLHGSGTITCYRCRHSVSFRSFNPGEEEAG